MPGFPSILLSLRDETKNLEGFPGGSVAKNLTASAGDSGLIPGWGRSPGGGSGNPL